MTLSSLSTDDILRDRIAADAPQKTEKQSEAMREHARLLHAEMFRRAIAGDADALQRYLKSRSGILGAT